MADPRDRKYAPPSPEELSGDKTLLGYKLPANRGHFEEDESTSSGVLDTRLPRRETPAPAAPARRPAGPSAARPAAAPSSGLRPAVPGPAAPAPSARPARLPAPPAPRPAPAAAPAGDKSDLSFFPQEPKTLRDTGLTETALEEMVLKALFFGGEMRGIDVARKLRLPSSMVDETLEGLRKAKMVDIKGGSGGGLGRSTMIYVVTTFAREVLQQVLDRNRYNGPAPVPYGDYIAAVKAQTIRGSRITRERMEDKFDGLIIRDDIYDGIGPAMNSGKAIFFYGPPGNGKTAICQRMTNCFEGEVFIPYAVTIDGFVVKVFDEVVHRTLPYREGEPKWDERWARCRRPLVVVGGELMLEMLDMAYSPEVKFYEAPLQMKANNGMLLIDDFGRQRVSPKDLLNRWIVPLESEVDYLSLVTGKKLTLPFDVFVVFSTNLDPRELVDDAFLRRVRYKLEVRSPDEVLFKEIFQLVCQQKAVPYDAAAVEYLIATHYKGDPPRRFAACQPRDLVEQIVDQCHYRGIEPRLTPEMMDRVARGYFVRFGDA